MTTTAAPPPPRPDPTSDERHGAPGVDRAAVQRRVLQVLAAGQIVGAAALAAAVTVGAFVIQDILGHDTPWAGLGTATVTVGTAVMSKSLSRLMGRRGRRRGMQLGYALAGAGGLLAAAGAEEEQLLVFLAGLALFGSGQASNLLARYAAADLATPAERGRAMSRILFASTFGAVLGPVLVNPAERAGQDWLGLGPYTGPWLVSAVLFLAAGVNTAIRLRPDPLVLAGGLDADRRRETSEAGPPAPARAFRAIAASRWASLALAAMVVSQVAMVAVMTMTPVHLRHHGHETVSAFVISTHIAGMYAFSPLVGRFSDRRGRVPALVVGAALLVASCALAALSRDVEQLLFPALWLLGVGWSFGLIAGSALLVDAIPAARRVAVQGTADLLMSACGGAAGFSSGFIRQAVGFPALTVLAGAAAAALLAATVAAGRAWGEPRPVDPVVATSG